MSWPWTVAAARSAGRPPRRTDKAAYATPFVFEPAKGPAQLILASSAHGISSLDPASGKPNWELPSIKARVVASPILADGRIQVQAGSGGGGHQFLVVDPAGPGLAEKPALAYEVKPPLPYVPTCVSTKGRMYLWGDVGVVTCIDAAKGDIRWRERVGGNYFSSPVCLGDRVCNVSREGQFVMLAAADEYKLLGKVELGEASQSTPAYANGTLYIRTLTHVMALPAK